MRKVFTLAIYPIVAALMLTGCGSGASADKPIAEVKQEAQKMDVTQLKSMVEKYQQAIEAKKPEIAKLQNKLKEIPIAQLMGDEAKAIKGEIGQITASIKALTDRMKIYASELRTKQ